MSEELNDRAEVQRKFTKIFSDYRRTTVSWEQSSSNKRRWEGHTVTVQMPAHEDFYEALLPFGQEAVQYHSLPEPYLTRTKAHGIQLVYDKMGTLEHIIIDCFSTVPHQMAEWKWKTAPISVEDWALSDFLERLEAETTNWLRDIDPKQLDIFEPAKEAE